MTPNLLSLATLLANLRFLEAIPLPTWSFSETPQGQMLKHLWLGRKIYASTSHGRNIICPKKDPPQKVWTSRSHTVESILIDLQGERATSARSFAPGWTAKTKPSWQSCRTCREDTVCPWFLQDVDLSRSYCTPLRFSKVHDDEVRQPFWKSQPSWSYKEFPSPPCFHSRKHRSPRECKVRRRRVRTVCCREDSCSCKDDHEWTPTKQPWCLKQKGKRKMWRKWLFPSNSELRFMDKIWLTKRQCPTPWEKHLSGVEAVFLVIFFP